jgi:uncharacterized protein YuzE
MRITYDPEVDILMVRMHEAGNRRARGAELPFGDAYADLAADGTILAIEIQNASQKYPLELLLANKVAHGPLSLAEASERSGISPQALRKACEEGRMKGQKIGRNWTVTMDALLDYRDSRKHAGPGSASEAAAG